MRPPPAKTQDKKYKTRMCRYGAGTCPYGVSCSYAHSAVAFRADGTLLGVREREGVFDAVELAPASAERSAASAAGRTLLSAALRSE